MGNEHYVARDLFGRVSGLVSGRALRSQKEHGVRITSAGTARGCGTQAQHVFPSGLRSHLGSDLMVPTDLGALGLARCCVELIN